MATQSSVIPACLVSHCAGCAKCITSIDQRCRKCKFTFYCSRECRKGDWKKHKKTCFIWASEEPPSPESWMMELISAPEPSPPCGIDSPIHLPYMSLLFGTWLHDRTKTDTYRLLIDAYRLYADDRFFLDRVIEPDTIYNRKPSSLAGFRRFLDAVEKKPGLLPSWWTDTTRAECEEFGLRPDIQTWQYVEKRVPIGEAKESEKGEKDDKDEPKEETKEETKNKAKGKAIDQQQFEVVTEKQEVTIERWSSLSRRATKWSIMQHYEDPSFPNQLRIFAEDVYGTSPGFINIAEVRDRMAYVESGLRF